MEPHAHGHDVGRAITPFLDPAQESLSQALRAGFRVLSIIMIVLVVAYFASGWFQLDPGEQGLIVRLGALRENVSADDKFAGTRVFGPGWHASLPDPIDEKIRLQGVTFRLEVNTFCFARKEDQRAKPLSETVPRREKIDPATDGTMLSGDRNLSHGVWTLEYQIADAERFVRHVGDRVEAARPFLKAALENAVTETVAGAAVERITRTGIRMEGEDVTLDVKLRLMQELNRFETGLTVVKVTAETIEPAEVREAFQRVTRAQNEQASAISEARKQRDEILNETAGPSYERLLAQIDAYGAAQAAGAAEADLAAQRAAIDSELELASGKVAVTLRDAYAHANEIRERARQEQEQFTHWLAAYRKSPRATAMRLWKDMRTAILNSKDNEVLFLPRSAESIEILTNRDPEKAIEAEREKYMQRYRP